MIHFKRIFGQNIGTHTKFDFRLDRPGLTLVHGKEGSGKSTIFYALCLVLYGETPRDGRQRTALYHPVRKNCLVGVHFTANGHEYRVTRAWKHKERGTGVWIVRDRLDETPYTQDDAVKAVIEILGMSYGEFTTAVFLPQGASTVLLDRSPGASARRWEFLAALSGCGQLDELMVAAKEEAAPIKGLLKAAQELTIALTATTDAAVSRRAVFARGFMERTKARLRYLTKQNNLWDAHDRYTLQLTAAETRASDLKRQLAKLENPETPDVDVKALKAERADLVRSLDKLDDQFKAAKELARLEVPKSSSEVLDRKLEKLEKEDRYAGRTAAGIRAITVVRESLDGKSNCPTCGHVVAEDAVAEELRNLNGQLEALEKQQDAIREMAGILERRRSTAIKFEAIVKQTGGKSTNDLTATIDKLERRLPKIDARLEAAMKAKASQAAYTETLVAYREANDAVASLRGLKVKRPAMSREACNDGIEQCHRRLLHQATCVERATAQERQTGELRKSLEKLKADTDRCRLMETLASAAESVRRKSVERATDELIVQAGKRLPISDRLQVTVGAKRLDLSIRRTSEKKTYDVAASRLSRGEFGKLNAALTLAVKAVSPAGRRTNLLILDEPAAHVSEAGWLDFLDSLASERKPGQSIIVSTHVAAAQESAVWDHVIEVVKTGDESSILARR